MWLENLLANAYDLSMILFMAYEIQRLDDSGKLIQTGSSATRSKVIIVYLLLMILLGASIHANDSKTLNHKNFRTILLDKVKNLKGEPIYLSHESGAECIIVEDEGKYRILIIYLVSLKTVEAEEYLDINVIDATAFANALACWKLDLKTQERLNFFLAQKSLRATSEDTAKFGKKSNELLFFKKVIEIDNIFDHNHAYTIAEIYFSEIDTKKESIKTNIH